MTAENCHQDLLLVTDRVDVGLSELVRRFRPDASWSQLQLDTSSLPDDRLAPLLRELAPEAHRLVSDFMLATTRDLPRMRIGSGGERLAHALRAGQRSEWWFLETSERSPFRGTLVRDLYRLAMIRLLAQRRRFDEIHVALDDARLQGILLAARATLPPLVDHGRSTDRRVVRLLRPVVRYWPNGIREIAGALLARLAILNVRTRTPPRNAIAVFTIFPNWWLDAFGTGGRDRFFSVLPSTRAYFAAWTTGARRLWKHRGVIGQTLAERRVVLISPWIAVGSILSALSPSGFVRLVRFQISLRRRIRSTFAGFNVAELVADDVAASLSSPEVFHCRLLEAGVSAFVRATEPIALIYRAEFQPLERALLIAAADRTTIAFRHTPFAERYLPLRFAPGELTSNTSDLGPDGMPLPNWVMTSGPAAAERLAQDGFPGDRIVICGPQRLGALVERRRRVTDRAALRAQSGFRQDEFVLFAATGTMPDETMGLFRALGIACVGDRRIRVLVKPHPGWRRGAPAIDELLAASGLSSIGTAVNDAATYDLMLAADAVVTAGSTIAFEALALAAPVIVYEDARAFVANSATEHGVAFKIAHDPWQLRAEIEELARDPGRLTDPAIREATLRRALGDIDTDLRSQLDAALRYVGLGE